jgi:hypothetical protein
MHQEAPPTDKERLGNTRALPRRPPPDGKRPLFPAIFPDQLAPIVRNGGDGRSASSRRRARACRGRRNMTERRS